MRVAAVAIVVAGLLASCGGEDYPPGGDSGAVACAPLGSYDCTCQDDSNACGNTAGLSYAGEDYVEAASPVCSLDPPRKSDTGWFAYKGCQVRRWDETNWTGIRLVSYRHTKVACAGILPCEVYTRCICDPR